ncbi:hypothetical protein [Endozoicomonas sp. 8E]|uniref:hypothetical protein n=1 Tax=Endozoicomonas sp. 8E TaxID=3035692 RepID=UPI002938DC0C|nr:hypothetical protein [Endozoicomonas sp. 8E]WOG28114.1 hypothetical protein P6910_00215 [Endozoicomonas sp. 8E]
MERVLRVLPVLVLSVSVTFNGIAFAGGEKNIGVLMESNLDKPGEYKLAIFLIGFALGGTASWVTYYLVSHSFQTNTEDDSNVEKGNCVGLSSNQSTASSNSSALMQTTKVPEHYQKTIIDQHNLLPFSVDEDNYADAKKKLKYLWARATLLDAHPLHLDEGKVQPALFPLNTAYDPVYPIGSATELCISPLPKPLTKKFRCNDQQLTGFCRVKFMLNGKISTLVGMLANTPDNVSGCLLSSRKRDNFLVSLGDETLLPRDILVSDKKYYQINVTYDKVSYQFQDWLWNLLPFASTILLSGSLRHESLCKDGASPGVQWYNDGAHSSEYRCAALTAEAEPAGDISHFIPVRQKAHESRPSPVIWQEVPLQEDKGTVSIEVQKYFCSPRKPYKEFMLGSLAGEGVDKYCTYIGTSGKSGFVATNQDGSIASDYLTPAVDGNIRWQAFEDDLPEKAIIAGYSFSSSGKKISKVPEYFCRFVNNGFKTYGKYFKKSKDCKASFATPNGDSHALVDSKTFEILVGE